ncbi:hypothetical protein D7X98_17805 [bacterium 1XD8-76]|nr:hypothetical protein D7X98_17805 [bacterium 1XD8-76]
MLPVQVQNTGANGRGRRMNPTKTAYMVYYQDISGSGYQWSEQALTHELGQKIVDAGTTVERRVLAGVYVLLYVAAWCVTGGMKRRTGQT